MIATVRSRSRGHGKRSKREEVVGEKGGSLTPLSFKEMGDVRSLTDACKCRMKIVEMVPRVTYGVRKCVVDKNETLELVYLAKLRRPYPNIR